MNQNSFITNQDKLMSEIVKGILPKTRAIDILVGYFFFSGYHLLSQCLANKNIRILVGLEVDKDVSKGIQVITPMSASNLRITSS